MSARLVNLTPHTVCIYVGDRIIRVEPHSNPPTVARLQETLVPTASIAYTVDYVSGTAVAIPTSVIEYGEIENLPKSENDVIFIASAMVAAKAKRPDVVGVDSSSSGCVRDSSGRIIGTRGLVRYA